MFIKVGSYFLDRNRITYIFFLEYFKQQNKGYLLNYINLLLSFAMLLCRTSANSLKAILFFEKYLLISC